MANLAQDLTLDAVGATDEAAPPTHSLPRRRQGDNATGEILVAPDHRRRGVRRRILDRLCDEARRAGRVRLIGEAHAPLAGSAPGPAFAAAFGAREVLADVRRRLHLPDHPARPGRAQPSGRVRPCAVVRWHPRGVARRHRPPHRPDVHRRSAGRAALGAGALRRRSGPRPGRDVPGPWHPGGGHGRPRRAGTLAAFTEIAVMASVGWHGANWDTLVAPEHRGHGLGLRVKLANLALARDFSRRCARWTPATRRPTPT